jgi:ABC-type phosphate transport system permease subunit
LELGILITLIVAMIKQSNTDLSPSVKTLTWCTLAYIILSYLWGTGYNIALSIAHPALASNPLALLRAAADTSPSESIGVLLMLVFSIGCSAVIGTFGFIYLNEFRKTRRTPPPLPNGQPETESRDRKTDVN